MRTELIGLPGSGKTTYLKNKNMQGLNYLEVIPLYNYKNLKLLKICFFTFLFCFYFISLHNLKRILFNPKALNRYLKMCKISSAVYLTIPLPLSLDQGWLQSYWSFLMASNKVAFKSDYRLIHRALDLLRIDKLTLLNTGVEVCSDRFFKRKFASNKTTQFDNFSKEELIMEFRFGEQLFQSVLDYLQVKNTSLLIEICSEDQ